MIFSSLPFLFGFLPLFGIIYFTVKTRTAKNIILLVFSLLFYAWGEPVYVFLMMFSIAADYIFGYYVSKYTAANEKKTAKRFVIASVIINLTILVFFKYTDFIIENLRVIPYFSKLEPLGLSLPIGISFYTFQTMSYTIDIYRKQAEVQKNIISFGAYVTAFPQLIAGPIIRYHTVAKQLVNRNETIDNFSAGMRRFISGLAKKVLIANTMAELCDNIFLKYSEESAAAVGALGMWLAVIAYTIQIYYDFSGYSDMAIGLARIMGFYYGENFDYPYISKSVTEFWRRWHISMGTFFRDYLYIPLGGNKVSSLRWVLNIMIVWFLTGLWHGAAWTFILWGLYFGVLLIIEKKFLYKNLLKIPGLNRLYTIIAFMFGWIIFRAESIPQIGGILSSMFGFYGTGSLTLLAENSLIKPMQIIMIAAGIIFCAPVSKYIKKIFEGSSAGMYISDAGSLIALVLCVVLLAQGSYNPFIYLRF